MSAGSRMMAGVICINAQMKERQMSAVESRVLMMATLALRYFGNRKDTWDATDYASRVAGYGVWLSRPRVIQAIAWDYGRSRR